MTAPACPHCGKPLEQKPERDMSGCAEMAAMFLAMILVLAILALVTGM